MNAASAFPALRLRFALRPSQSAAADAARRELDAGSRRLRIVAPPGSGKTVLGLWLWAEHVRRPARVLSPNSAIQAQWAARAELFDGVDDATVSADRQSPALSATACPEPTRLSIDPRDSLQAGLPELSYTPPAGERMNVEAVCYEQRYSSSRHYRQPQALIR